MTDPAVSRSQPRVKARRRNDHGRRGVATAVGPADQLVRLLVISVRLARLLLSTSAST